MSRKIPKKDRLRNSPSAPKSKEAMKNFIENNLKESDKYKYQHKNEEKNN